MTTPTALAAPGAALGSGNAVAAVGGVGDPRSQDTVDQAASRAARPDVGSGSPVPNRSAWTIGGLDPQERLMDAVARQAWRTEEAPPTPGQVAMVLHALADHTSLEQARVWDRMRGGREDHLWPTTLSIGRWLHAYGSAIEMEVLAARARRQAAPTRSAATAHTLVARASVICARCCGRITFVRLDGGKQMPVDVDPDPEGTVAVRVSSIGALRGRLLTAERPVVEGAERLHLTHFATCGRDEASPDAARHRDGVVPDYVGRAAARRADPDGDGLWEQEVLPTGPIPVVPPSPRPERTRR